MIILGVNCGAHDGAAALVINGELVRLVEAERITRRKRHFHHSPGAAVHACLAAEGLTFQSVDVVACGWDYPALVEYGGDQVTDDELDAFYEWLLDRTSTRHVSEVYGNDRRHAPVEPLPRDLPPLAFVPHHDAHFYSSMPVSGLAEASIIVADGRGETCATSIGVARDGKVEWYRTWPLHQSLGNLCGFAAEWAGLDFWAAGKLMGLAAYGRPNQPSPLSVDEDGYRIAVRPATTGLRPIRMYSALRWEVTSYWDQHCYPYAEGGGRDIMAYADFAATVQEALESSVESLYRTLERAGGPDRLVFSGGVGMNCSMIGRLVRTAGIADLFVPSFTYDAGVSAGAALAVAAAKGEPVMRSERMRSAYLGMEFTGEQVATALDGTGLVFQRLPEPELLDRAAGLLADDKVIGWFNGRAEVGQRALGNRSILADPRNRSNYVRVNDIKGREMWRPLAPSVPTEYLAKLFEIGQARSPYDFMLAAAPVRPEAARTIPATVHVDGSARPQAVSRETNPRYWELIDRFRRLTGVPCVLNTSFNLAGSPIVNSPVDAVATFTSSGLDALVIGDFVVTKRSAE